MLLYLFVATPVQFWHHHDYGKITSKTAIPKQQRIEKSNTGNTEINCQVCNHHYSIYQDDFAKDFSFYAYIFGKSYTDYFVSIPETPVISFSNKGPPQLG